VFQTTRLLRDFVRNVSAFEMLRKVRSRVDYLTWDKSSFPSPHYAKQKIVVEYAKIHGTETLIETGTCFGFMVEAMRNHFKHIFSIELNHALFEHAVTKFRKYPHIVIYEGDSTTVLPRLLMAINPSRCLFWLDGHYSGGVTSKGQKDTPILDELEAIFQYVERPVILIDDARYFTGNQDYPTLEKVRELATSHGLAFANKNDVIRLTPTSLPPCDVHLAARLEQV
jgi:hypothetical protein